MSKAYWINSQLKKIIVVDCQKDVAKYTGGTFCIGRVWHDTGDVLYVNDEGLLKPGKYWFMVPGQPQPLSGDGIVVGQEVDTGSTWWNEDVKISVSDMGIKFMSVGEVRAWAILNENTPAMLINGEVIETYGNMMKKALGDE